MVCFVLSAVAILCMCRVSIEPRDYNLGLDHIEMKLEFMVVFYFIKADTLPVQIIVLWMSSQLR